MKTFFRKLFYSEKKLILSEILATNQGILEQMELTLAETRAIHGDSKSKGTELKLEVQKMSGELEKLTRMIYEMVNSLSKYFKIEVEFMEKEKEKTTKKPTEHDSIF